MTGVAIVDDHRLVRAGLRTLLESTADLAVVGEAGNGAEAVDLVRTTEPDVVLMDLSMPEVDGIEATRRIMDLGLPVAVIVLTSFAESPRVTAALEAGAVGYLLKDSEPRDVVSAVRSAAAGHAPIDPRVARALLPRRAGSPQADPTTVLSARERQVLEHVAKGMANKQIARALGISERTVKVHLGNVFRALGVGDRTSAALWAHDHGIGSGA